MHQTLHDVIQNLQVRKGTKLNILIVVYTGLPRRILSVQNVSKRFKKEVKIQDRLHADKKKVTIYVSTVIWRYFY